MKHLKIRVQTSVGDVDYYPINDKTCYNCGLSIMVNFQYFLDEFYPELRLADLAFNFVFVEHDQEVI